jgi:hypothetical protein
VAITDLSLNFSLTFPLFLNQLQELSKIFQQDAADIAAHETFITYNVRFKENLK